MNDVKVNEIFRPIKGYEELYLVSNLGRIKSVRYNKFLKLSKQNNYLGVTLCDNKRRKTVQVHVLVATAFFNEEPIKGIKVVHHINHNGNDNRLSNLKIVSHRENCSLRKKDNGLPTGVEKHRNRYHSKIVINGKQKRLGSYETKEEASFVYQQELKKHLDKKNK